MHAYALLGSLALLASVAPQAQLQREHPWGRWQVGAWAEVETRDSAREGQVLVERVQLKSVDEDGFVLKSSTKTSAGEREVDEPRSWALGGHPHVQPGGERVGEDTLEVEGKAWPCEVWEVAVQGQGQVHRERAWIADGLPHPLRMETFDANSKVSLEVVDLSEHVELGGRKLPCVVYEGVGRVNGDSVRVRLWTSTEVPGGMLRLRTEVGVGASAKVTERKVLRYRGVPLIRRTAAR